MAWSPPSSTKPLTSWSFSRFGTYTSCPFKFKLTVLEKREEPKNAAMERGNEIHKLAEVYLKGNLARLPKELGAFPEEFKRLRAKRKKDPQTVIVEDTWAFTAQWTPTRWDDWKGCWVRIKLDCAELTGNVLVPSDWKTGKFRDDNVKDYLLQLELYALGGLLTFKDRVENLVVRPRLVYLDQQKIHEAGEYTVADLKPLMKTWTARVKPMFNDKKFAPRPHQWCYSCHFRKDNGGPCVH